MTTNDKTNATEQLSLVFELYHRIPQGRKVTASELKAELANAGIYRSIRSVQRNLDVIVEYFDVEKDTRSKPYGYRRRASFFPTLGARELLLLQLAKSTLIQHLPQSLQYAIDSAFGILDIQPRSYTGTKPPREGASKILSLTNTLKHPQLIERHFEPIAVALVQQRQVTLTLHSGEEIRQVSLLGLYVMSGELYLTYKNQPSNYLDLPLSEIVKLKVLTFHFDYPEDFDLFNHTLARGRIFTNATESQPRHATLCHSNSEASFK